MPVPCIKGVFCENLQFAILFYIFALVLAIGDIKLSPILFLIHCFYDKTGYYKVNCK